MQLLYILLLLRPAKFSQPGTISVRSTERLVLSLLYNIDRAYWTMWSHEPNPTHKLNVFIVKAKLHVIKFARLLISHREAGHA